MSLLSFTFMSMSANDTLTLVLASLPTLLSGVKITLGLVVACLGVGLLFGIPLALVHVYGATWSKQVAAIYDRVFRGFPALVLLFLFYFGLGSIEGISVSPFVAAVLALGLRSAAYQAQIYRGSLSAVEVGQAEAARSLGLTSWQTIWSIVLPQAIHFSLPGLANEYSIVLKDTALAFAVGLVEVMARGKFIVARTHAPLKIYLTVAAIYFVLTYTGTLGFLVLERRMHIPGFGRQGQETRQ